MSNNIKILLMDLETAPNVADVWKFFRTNVGVNQVRRNGRIIMWAAKFLNDPTIHTMNEIDNGREKMLRGLHALMEEADVIVGQNGDRFDIRWANWEFLKEGLDPPAPSKTVDTLKVLRNRFYLPSYRLDYVCRQLGLGRKVKHVGHELWLGWEAKDEKAKATMIRYCINDVKLLQRLYYKIRPWIKNHPVVGLYSDKGRPSCPNCGSTKVHKKGRAYTNAGIYHRYKCSDCGTPIRGKRMVADTAEQRKNILTQIK